MIYQQVVIKNINDDAKFIQGTTLSISDLSELFKNNNFDCVIHLAASKAAGESMLIHQNMLPTIS